MRPHPMATGPVPYRSILFVCDVNTCRSPMAEAMLKGLLASRGVKDGCIRVASGGIAPYAREGGAVSLDAKLLMKEEGADGFLDGFRSRDLKRHLDMVRGADLILTMTRLQRDKVRAMPEAKGRQVYTLKEFSGEDGDIEDPAGGGEEAYLACKEEIRRCLEKALKLIMGETDARVPRDPP